MLVECDDDIFQWRKAPLYTLGEAKRIQIQENKVEQ